MQKLKPKFTLLQFFGYLFILLLIVLSFSGIADKIAMTLMTETQQSTAIYALLLKTTASGLTFIPDNDALAPFIDTFDRAGTLLFIASLTITLQKVILTLLQTPIFSIIMVAMLIVAIANKLSRALDASFTILVRKYLIILLLIRFFLTASALIIYGSIGALLDSNDANNVARTELLNFNIKEITDSASLIQNQNALLQKDIDTLEAEITTNKLKIETIGTNWIDAEDARVLKLRAKNHNLNKQIDILDDKKINSFGITANVKIAMANITAWFKNISEGIFTTVSIFLLKIVIFPFITYVIAYKFGRSIIGNNTVDLIKNSFKKKKKKNTKNNTPSSNLSNIT